MKKGRSTERKEQKRQQQQKGGFERPCLLLRFKKKREKREGKKERGRERGGGKGRRGETESCAGRGGHWERQRQIQSERQREKWKGPRELTTLDIRAVGYPQTRHGNDQRRHRAPSGRYENQDQRPGDKSTSPIDHCWPCGAEQYKLQSLQWSLWGISLTP